MASGMFAKGIQGLCTGRIDWDTHTIRAILVKSSYDSTPQFDTHEFVSDIPAADRADGTTAQQITGVSSIDGAGNDVEFDHNAASISFPTVTTGQRIGGIVVFKSSSTTESECPLICYNKLTANVTSDGGTFTVNFATEGIWKASY